MNVFFSYKIYVHVAIVQIRKISFCLNKIFSKKNLILLLFCKTAKRFVFFKIYNFIIKINIKYNQDDTSNLFRMFFYIL